MRCCCVIPVFNHAATAPAVIERARAVMRDVLVIDDGSDDIDLAKLYENTDVEVVRHPRNLGKGASLLTAIRTLAPRGYDYMITLDADAQHDPEDIRRFLPLLESGGRTVVAGVRDFSVPNVPRRSKIGRALSDFCFLLETGKRISDSQSGFRAYPLPYVSRIRCTPLRYEFETESGRSATTGAWSCFISASCSAAPSRSAWKRSGGRPAKSRIRRNGRNSSQLPNSARATAG